MRENNSKSNNLEISIKKISNISHSMPISYKKFSEDSLSENTFITSINVNKNYKHLLKKINNSDNL